VHKWMKTLSSVFGNHVDRQKAKIKKNPPIIINLETKTKLLSYNKENFTWVKNCLSQFIKKNWQN
jgi:hypothetical protein